METLSVSELKKSESILQAHSSTEHGDINDDNCDDLIKQLVVQSKTGKSKTSKQSVQVNPDCEIHGEAAKKKELEDGPCPEGAKRCCTCGVCPEEILKTRTKSADVLKQGARPSDEDLDARMASELDHVASTERTKSLDSDESIFDDWSDLTKYGRKHKKQKQYGEDGEGRFKSSPTMSARSRQEGSEGEDYMKFFIEPLDICYRSLSSLSSSYISCEDTGLQRTIVIVKPEAVKFKEAIYRVIFEAGFQILGLRVLHLSPEQVSEIYSKFYGSPSFVQLVVTVSEAPVLAICISAMNVIKRWLMLIGPDGSLRAEWFYPLSMRKLFGLVDTHANWIHGSENFPDSNKENRYFYPDSILEPITKDEDKVWDYCSVNVNKSILAACTEVVKKRPADPIIFLADYLLFHNPFQPRLPKNIAMTPT